MSNQPPRIPLAEIHPGSDAQNQQEGPWVRTIGQGWKSTQSPQHRRLWATWQSHSPALSSGNPFPIMSLPLPACVSPQKINFWVLNKSPLLGLGRKEPPFLGRGDPTPSATIMNRLLPCRSQQEAGPQCAGRYLHGRNRSCDSHLHGECVFPQSLSKRQWLWNYNHRSIN